MASGFTVDRSFARPRARADRAGAGGAAAAPRRYAFPPLDAPDRCPLPAAEAGAPPASTFGEAELAAAVAEARREGFAEGEAAGRAEAEARLGAERERALARLAERLVADGTAMTEAIERRAAAATELALAAARAVVPAALARLPLADVAEVLRDCFAPLRDQPALELALAPELVEPGDALLRPAAAAAGFRGELAVVADPALPPGDARLCWRDGWAERDVARLMAQAEALVRRRLPAPDAALTNDDPKENTEP